LQLERNPEEKYCYINLASFESRKECGEAFQDPIDYNCKQEVKENGGSVYECRRLYEQREHFAKQDAKFNRLQQEVRTENHRRATEAAWQQLGNMANQINTENRINKLEYRPTNNRIPLSSGSKSVPIN